MVTIRLSRAGAKKRPFYHIVVTDSRNKRDGKYLEKLGFYNPIAVGGEEKIKIDSERLSYWVSHGAQIAKRVKRVVKESKETPEETDKRIKLKEERRIKKLENNRANKEAAAEVEKKEEPKEAAAEVEKKEEPKEAAAEVEKKEEPKEAAAE
ncbi:MAG: 30S ribosomal protein S16, partial [Pseudomonadota bacterium]|nr:30S ribosomal protein S16 [Pseudomonadota bacterium]